MTSYVCKHFSLLSIYKITSPLLHFIYCTVKVVLHFIFLLLPSPLCYYLPFLLYLKEMKVQFKWLTYFPLTNLPIVYSRRGEKRSHQHHSDHHRCRLIQTVAILYPPSKYEYPNGISAPFKTEHNLTVRNKLLLNHLLERKKNERKL